MKSTTRNTIGRQGRLIRQRKPLVGRTKAGEETHGARGDHPDRTGSKSPHRIRVLVAEDHRLARAGLVETLARIGMRVRRVDNPYDVLMEVESFRPEVVFLDDHFEGSGAAYRSLIPELRSRFPRVRVVVTYDEAEGTGTTGRDRASAPLTWGAVASIERGKTLDGEAVERYVKEAVEA